MHSIQRWGGWLLAGVLIAGGCGHATTEREVVAYVSLDQVYAEPILRKFEAQTGIQMRAVYDTEATKTTGLANRLLAERRAPRADVFWNSEVVRTLVLKRKGVLAAYRSPEAASFPDRLRDPEGYWTGFASRARVIAVNPRLLPRSEWPATIEELVEPQWRGRVAMAYPLFGTTSTHVAALFALWGPERATRWLRSLAENEVAVVDGNSTARDLVVSGLVPVALTDSDDVASAKARGDEIEMLFPDKGGVGALVIPNTVALIAGAPHPEMGKRLIDFLLSPEVERLLAGLPGAQIPVRDAAAWPQQLPPRKDLDAMRIDFDAVAAQLGAATAATREIFVR